MLSALIHYGVAAQRAIRQLIDQRPRFPVPLVLEDPFPQVINTSSRCLQSVSRRSKPSSRGSLIGEQPYPWLLLQSQDDPSRQRSNKPQRRYELLAETIPLSPG